MAVCAYARGLHSLGSSSSSSLSSSSSTSSSTSSSLSSSSSSSSSSRWFLCRPYSTASEAPSAAAAKPAAAAGGAGGAEAAAAEAAAGAAAAAAGAAAAAAAAAAAGCMPLRGYLLFCCGAALIVGGLGGCLWLLLEAPEPLQVAWDIIQKDPRVVAALGGEVKRNWWWGGFVHEGDARIKLSLTATRNPMARAVTLFPEQLPREKQHQNFMRGCISNCPVEGKQTPQGDTAAAAPNTQQQRLGLNVFNFCFFDGHLLQ
ncbi:hypothetical protein, conserved [Eimeria brunetti]|uniref:Transmembrane protein n=1 Tax=Eimeria brunetti TaxID=51314 RepID=U6LFX6_9EIME|nr:hypothetical protein, conserved [Eimeria brunetti]